MKSRRLRWGILALAAGLASAQCAPKRPQYAITYAEARAKLPNGLKLVIMPDRTTPLVQVDVRYEVGSNEDPPEKAGLAHYVEHMAFQFRLFGEDGPPLFDILPQVATGYNAYTMPDRTHYYLQGPKEDVAILLNIEARRMEAAQTLCEAIPDAEFTRELDVVRNEIRQRYGTADGLVLPIILETIFPAGHPYAHTAGGLDANLVRITKKDVCQFFKDYYHPSRATLLVAGNVDPDEIGKLVMGAFGSLPAGEPKPRKPVPHVQTEHRRVVHALDVERPTVAIAWSLPPMTSDEYAKAGIAAWSLSSRAADFASKWDFAASAGAFVIGASTQNGAGGPHSPVLLLFAQLYKNDDVDRAFDYLWRAAERAHWRVRDIEDSVDNPDKDTVAVEKARYIMSLEPLAARTEEVANLMQFGNRTDFFGGNTFILDRLAEIEKVDVGDLRAFVKANLAKNRGTEFVFRADPKGRKADAQAGGRLASAGDVYQNEEALVAPGEAQKPAPFPNERGLLATAERYELSNGMKVVLLPYKTLPIMTARLEFAAGSVHEPANRTGVAFAASRFLAPPRDADVFFRLGIQTSAASGGHSTSFTARSISLYQKEILHALERWISVGVYDQRGIERWQEGLERNYRIPSVRQDEAFTLAIRRAFFGPEHPNTVTGSPTMASYKSIGVDALNSFRRKHYSAANATLYVVGNFDVDVVKASIREHFGGWSRGHRDEPVRVPAAARSGPVYLGAVGRDVLNTRVSIFFPGPMGIDDEYPLRLLASRMLHQAVYRTRTKLGTTYGIGSGWSPSLGPSSYTIGGPFESATGVETMQAILAEIENLRSGENHEVEFVRARRAVMASLLGQSTMTANMAATLAYQDSFGLPRDARWQTMKGVATAKPEDVLRVLQRDLDPERAVVALMADEETLKKLFAAIGVEDPEILPMPN